MSQLARENEHLSPAAAPVDLGAGLTAAEAGERLRLYGPNVLVSERRERLWRRLLRPLFEPMALLLLGAGVVYLLLGERRDATVMLLALIPIVAVDYVLEERAQRTLAGLKRLVAPRADVLRDGHRQTVDASELVPGDVVYVQEGDILPADGLLVAGSDIRVDESSLTGEPYPVAKEPSTSAEGELFAGTTLVSGRGVVLVSATGQRTEYGRIGALVAEASPRPTSTQRAISGLVRRMVAVAIGFVLIVVGIELAHQSGWTQALSAGVSLGIAVIPEEFLVVFTLYLTLGAWRMARRHALVRRLAGVETLGAVSVICADKTGTLTEGRMSPSALYASGVIYGLDQAISPATAPLIEAAVLASEPDPYDPLEQSLLGFARKADLDVDELYARWRLVEEYPFEPGHKLVSHVWRERSGSLRLYSKGPIEAVLAVSRASVAERERALQANVDLAAAGMRVLAVGQKQLSRYTGNREIDEGKLQFLGLIGFTDPPRAAVRDSILECQRAGIRVMMITGDHPLTAHNIAEAIGLNHVDERILTGYDLDQIDDRQLKRALPEASIFARISPAQKHRLVRALKELGAVVAMTGDGINDAPALREADVGVAMGQRGTEVAREAATMVLLDDNFETIVAAVREGRRIYDNLRQVFRYLVAFHMPILLPALIVPLLDVPLLLLPVHLVWLELILHPTASLVFEADPAAPDLMRRPPRSPKEPFLTAGIAMTALAEGLAIAAATLVTYFVVLDRGVGAEQARAMAITALVFAQMALVMMERSPSRPFWETGLRGNLFLPPILLATLLSLLALLYVPPVASAVGFVPLGGVELAVSGLIGLACTVPLELRKYFGQGQ